MELGNFYGLDKLSPTNSVRKILSNISKLIFQGSFNAYLTYLTSYWHSDSMIRKY